MNDYEPDFNYDQDDYIEDDIISQLNDTSIRDNISPETQQLINNFKRKWYEKIILLVYLNKVLNNTYILCDTYITL